MSYWQTEQSDGVVIAKYHNPPMNYFCAEGTQELWKLIEDWRDPAIRAVVLTGAMEGQVHYPLQRGRVG